MAVDITIQAGQLSETINIPDEQVDLVKDAYSYVYDYPEQVEDENGDMVNNPESENAHALRRVREQLKDKIIDTAKRYKAQTAVASAKQQVDTDLGEI